MKIAVKITKEVEVAKLKVTANVRYWEDATVNGETLEDGAWHKMPFGFPAAWQPVIDVETGTIIDWPNGTTASVHFKVCDEGTYTLLDADNNVLIERQDYVPSILCPKEKGYGDYIIMDIGADGIIDGWDAASLSEFESDNEE